MAEACCDLAAPLHCHGSAEHSNVLQLPLEILDTLVRKYEQVSLREVLSSRYGHVLAHHR